MVAIPIFGDRILTGKYTMHSRFAGVVNFSDGENLVSIVDMKVGGGPVNIVVSDPGIFSAADHEFTLTVEDDHFVLNGVTVRKDSAGMYDSSMDLRKTDSGRFMPNLKLLRENLLRSAPPKSLAFLLDSTRENDFSSGFENSFAGRMRRGVGEMLEGNLAGGTKRIRGLGFGLTPSGDDFLSGFLLGCNAAEKLLGMDLSRTKWTVYSGAVGGNLISNAFLSLSREGRVFQAFGDLLRVMACSDERKIAACVEDMLRIGETSGADTAVGFLTACGHLPAVFLLERAGASEKTF